MVHPRRAHRHHRLRRLKHSRPPQIAAAQSHFAQLFFRSIIFSLTPCPVHQLATNSRHPELSLRSEGSLFDPWATNRAPIILPAPCPSSKMQPIHHSLQPTVFPWPLSCPTLSPMNTKPIHLIIVSLAIFGSLSFRQPQSSNANAPSYTSSGEMRPPRKLSRMGLPLHRLRHELQPRHVC